MKSKQILVAVMLVVATLVMATLKMKARHGFDLVSWWWVTLPLWMYPAAILAKVIIYLLCVGILKLYGKEVRNAR